MLRERIKFLKRVDGEFIDQKKVFIDELRQKTKILEGQRESLGQCLSDQQTELEAITHDHPHLQPSKRPVRRNKKEGRGKGGSKKNSKSGGDSEQTGPVLPTKQGYKWKGQKLRRMGVGLAVVLLTLGLLYNPMMYA